MKSDGKTKKIGVNLKVKNKVDCKYEKREEPAKCHAGSEREGELRLKCKRLSLKQKTHS